MRTGRRVVVAAAGAAVAASIGLGPAVAQVPEDRLVRMEDGRPKQIGALRIGKDVPLRKALRAYGKPTRKRSLDRRTICRVRWKEPGITVLAVTFGTRPRKRCDPRKLSVQNVRVTAAGWTTDRGLAVGDPKARVRELYGKLKDPFEKALYVLEEADAPAGKTPTLLAKVKRDRVTRLEVFVGAAGD